MTEQSKSKPPKKQELVDLLRLCERDMSTSPSFNVGVNPTLTLILVRDALKRAGVPGVP